MSDDTTTWLKKNPAINPLRRSLKTSLRFDVPSSAMNSSILSNPDKVKDQGLFIPRMLQKSNTQMRKSRAHEFKVPELLASKPVAKKEGAGSGSKYKRVPTPNRTRKSLLPVPKTKGQSNEKVQPKANLPRPSFIPGVSGRRTTAKRDLIKKVVELSEIKRKEQAGSQLKAGAGDSSVLRSILKKRASLRRTSVISSAKKPKAKKVLFDGFENSDGEKENVNLPLESPNDFNTALDEPTVFLNFPNGAQMVDSPFETETEMKQTLNWTVEDTKIPQNIDLTNVIQLWESYKENLNNIKIERSSIEDSFESLLQHNLNFQKQFETYKVTSEKMYCTLSKLGEEIEEELKKVMEGESPEKAEAGKCKRREAGRRVSDKGDKIKMSSKSKVIKKTSGRKSVPLMKKNFLTDMEDSFSLISKSNFIDKA